MDDTYETPQPSLLRRLVLLPFVLLDRVREWWFTRQWRKLLGAIPALAVAGAILVPVVCQRLANPATLAQRYKVAVNHAVAEDDPAAADVYLQKLVRLGVRDADVRYAMAFVAESQGNRQRAQALLTELSSFDDGHPKAHLWMAKQLAAGNAILSEAERETLIRHLQAALESSEPPSEAHVMLGQLYLQSQDYKLAIAQFEAVLADRPDLHLSLGQAYLKLDERRLAKREFESAAEYFRRRVESDPSDAAAIMSWALACHLQGDFPAAEKLMLEGLKQHPDDTAMLNLLAAFCIDRFDNIDPGKTAGSPGENSDARLELLERALRYAPNNPAALNRLAMFVSLEGEVGERARLKLKGALAGGKATATIHLILAIQAVVRGDLERAALHFAQGQQLNPNMPVLLNNYAWVMAHQAEPQLDRALALVNQAIEMTPAEPRIRETRGQIYVKLQRWREALADLEFALPSMAGDPELHRALGQVYHELGDEETAQQHWLRAQGSGAVAD